MLGPAEAVGALVAGEEVAEEDEEEEGRRAVNPIEPLSMRLVMSFSRPTNAPERMKRMLVVSTRWTCCGAVRQLSAHDSRSTETTTHCPSLLSSSPPWPRDQGRIRRSPPKS